MTAPLQINVDLTERSVQRYLTVLKAKPAQIGRAQYTAVNRTMKWAGVRIGRKLAQANNMPVGIFKGGKNNREGKRLRTKISHSYPGSIFRLGSFSSRSLSAVNEVTGRIWIGLNRVKAKYLGKARQTKRGIAVGRRFFYQGTRDEIQLREYPGRLPAVLFKNEKGRWQSIRESISPTAIKGVQSRIPAQLRKEMNAQLNYQVNVRGGR